MRNSTKPLFLFVEDDDEDWWLIETTFMEYSNPPLLERLEDVENLLERLRNPTLPCPDLVLLNFRMPKRNGHEIIQEMNKDPFLKEIPVAIMTTSLLEVDLLQDFLKSVKYVVKPISHSAVYTLPDFWDTFYSDSSPGLSSL